MTTSSDTNRQPTTVGQTTVVVSKILKGLDWTAHRAQVTAELEAGLRTQIHQRDLVLDSISDVEVVTGVHGTWARLTRTATASPRP